MDCRKSRGTSEDDADVLIVGSGFGGAVAAARLAQAGYSVLVLERGRRWTRATFPATPGCATDGCGAWTADCTTSGGSRG